MILSRLWYCSLYWTLTPQSVRQLWCYRLYGDWYGKLRKTATRQWLCPPAVCTGLSLCSLYQAVTAIYSMQDCSTAVCAGLSSRSLYQAVTAIYSMQDCYTAVCAGLWYCILYQTVTVICIMLDYDTAVCTRLWLLYVLCRTMILHSVPDCDCNMYYAGLWYCSVYQTVTAVCAMQDCDTAVCAGLWNCLLYQTVTAICIMRDYETAFCTRLWLQYMLCRTVILQCVPALRYIFTALCAGIWYCSLFGTLQFALNCGTAVSAGLCHASEGRRRFSSLLL